MIISRKKDVMQEQVQTCLAGNWLSISPFCFTEKKMPKVAPRSAMDSPLLLYFE